MFKRKDEEKAVNLKLNLPRDDVRAHLFEHFAGRKSETPLHNVAGCSIPVEAVLVRTFKPDPFKLAVKIGTEWYELAQVSKDDPGIRELYEAGRITEYGPSPYEIEREQKRQAEREAKEAAERAYKEERSRLAREREQRAQERHRRAVAQRMAGM